MRGEATLQAILGETASLVGRYGFDGTTIARITRVTGKPASSIYWFFPTKDDLVAAALEATYGQRAPRRPAWPPFDPATPLVEQLTKMLAGQFVPAETEAPVRLGIMVALEGSAAGSPAREPFRRRRERARQTMKDWWRAAAAAEGGAGSEWVGDRLAMLTLAFMDGHYIADVEDQGTDPFGREPSSRGCSMEPSACCWRRAIPRRKPPSRRTSRE